MQYTSEGDPTQGKLARLLTVAGCYYYLQVVLREGYLLCAVPQWRGPRFTYIHTYRQVSMPFHSRQVNFAIMWEKLCTRVQPPCLFTHLMPFKSSRHFRTHSSPGQKTLLSHLKLKFPWLNWNCNGTFGQPYLVSKSKKISKLKELSSLGKSFKPFPEAYLNEDYPTAEDIVPPKSNKLVSLKDLLCSSDHVDCTWSFVNILLK